MKLFIAAVVIAHIFCLYSYTGKDEPFRTPQDTLNFIGSLILVVWGLFVVIF